MKEYAFIGNELPDGEYYAVFLDYVAIDEDTGIVIDYYSIPTLLFGTMGKNLQIQAVFN